MPTSSRARWLAAGLALFLLAAVAPAHGFSAQSPRLGSLATVDFCVRKAGPEKGTVRFVQGKARCGVAELKVRVLSALGSQVSSVDGGATYVRVEGISARAAGSPEAASATVACPDGFHVLSGGYRVDAGQPSPDNNPAEVSVTESRASSDSSWSVTAFADDDEGVGSWLVVVYATCASTG